MHKMVAMEFATARQDKTKEYKKTFNAYTDISATEFVHNIIMK